MRFENSADNVGTIGRVQYAIRSLRQSEEGIGLRREYSELSFSRGEREGEREILEATIKRSYIRASGKTRWRKLNSWLASLGKFY